MECTHCKETFLDLRSGCVELHYLRRHSSYHKKCERCGREVYMYRDVTFKQDLFFHKCFGASDNDDEDSDEEADRKRKEKRLEHL